MHKKKTLFFESELIFLAYNTKYSKKNTQLLKRLTKNDIMLSVLEKIQNEFHFERNITMTKTDLVNVVAAEAQISKKDADAAVAAVFAAITNALKEGDKVQLIGFGTFEVKEVSEREGRNPKTGETIKIAATKKPAFAASKVLKDEVNA